MLTPILVHYKRISPLKCIVLAYNIQLVRKTKCIYHKERLACLPLKMSNDYEYGNMDMFKSTASKPCGQLLFLHQMEPISPRNMPPIARRRPQQ